MTGRLHQIIVEATQALSRRDADRLEEIAFSCQPLNRELLQADIESRCHLQSEARAATQEMAIFARVLEMTQANASVLNRGREARATGIGYLQGPGSSWTNAESRHGDN